MEEVKKAEVREEAQLEVVVTINNIQPKTNMPDAKREDGNKFLKGCLEKMVVSLIKEGKRKVKPGTKRKPEVNTGEEKLAKKKQ